MGVVLNILKLVVADLLDQLIINLTEIPGMGLYILRINKLVLGVLQHGHTLPEIRHGALVAARNIFELDNVLGLHDAAVEVEPQLVARLVVFYAVHGVLVGVFEVDGVGLQGLHGGLGGVEVWVAGVQAVF